MTHLKTPAGFNMDQMALDLASSLAHTAADNLYDAADIILRTFPLKDDAENPLLIPAEDAEALRKRLEDLRRQAIKIWEDLNKARGVI